MKRRMLLLIAMVIFVACMLAFSVSAKEYNPTTGAELNNAISEAITLSEDSVINLNGSYTDYRQDAGYTAINSSNKITFELKGDSEIACRFVINGAGMAVFNLNQYTLSNKTGRGGTNGCFFFVDDDGALEIYNGMVKISDVAITFQDGRIKLNNVNIDANEEVIWCQQGACDGSGRLYEIENCTLSGNDGLNAYCMLDSSYIKNITIIKGRITFDSWHNHGAKECSAVVENIKASNSEICFWTSANTYTVKNSEFKKATVGGDNGGAGAYYFYDVKCTERGYTERNATLYDYKTPTCTEAGLLMVYSTSNQTGEEDASYKESNPALGHSFDKDNITGVSYNSYLENGFYTSKCLRCLEGTAAEEVETANPLFKFLGYSTPEDGSYGIVVSYMVDCKAIAEYEALTGKKLSYGIVAGAKQNLGDNNPLDKDGNAVTLDKGAVIKAEVGKEYSAYDFKLTGLGENQLDLELVMATYVVIDDGENVSVVYLQGTQLASGLGAISYNGIPNK